MSEFASFTLEVKNTPGVNRAVRAACNDIETFWKRNVKKYFDASDRYGNGRYSTRKPSQIVNAIDTIYAIRHDRLYMSVLIGDMEGKKGFDYLNALKYGVAPSNKAFVPALGVRIDSGRHAGSTNEAWVKWSIVFEKHIDRVMARLQEEIAISIVKNLR